MDNIVKALQEKHLGRSVVIYLEVNYDTRKHEDWSLTTTIRGRMDSVRCDLAELTMVVDGAEVVIPLFQAELEMLPLPSSMPDLTQLIRHRVLVDGSRANRHARIGIENEED